MLYPPCIHRVLELFRSAACGSVYQNVTPLKEVNCCRAALSMREWEMNNEYEIVFDSTGQAGQPTSSWVSQGAKVSLFWHASK